jgi:DNA-binding transcriptional ArsR family regulator
VLLPIALRQRDRRAAQCHPAHRFLCCCQSLSVNEIVEQLNVTQPTVSHHLAILRKAGLVEVREEGKQTFYSLNQAKITACCGRLMENFAPEKATTLQVKNIQEA